MMKRSITLVLSIFALVNFGWAQQSGWKITTLHSTLGVDINQYQAMSFDRLMSFSQDPGKMERALSSLEEEASATTGGAALSLRLSLSPFSKRQGQFAMDQELQLGVTLYSDKEAMVSFKNEDLDTSVVYCNVHSELAMEGAYLFSGQWGRRWEWYVGAGINGGVTFKNQMILLEGEYFGPDQHPSNQEVSMSDPQVFEAKRVLYARAFLPFGIHYKIGDKTSIGLDFRKGMGWQILPGGVVNFFPKNRSVGLGLRYSLI